MVGVRKATPDEAATIGEVLASAFRADPLWLWLTGLGRPDEARLRPLFTGLARINLARADHEVYLSEDGDSAAIWYPDGRRDLSPGEKMRLVPGSSRTLRWRGQRAIRFLLAAERGHPREPHHYLDLLGTRAERQGKGLGSTVLAPMLERCDAEGVPAYLAAVPRAAPLYARHGFVERGSLELPKGCPPLIPMWREPRPPEL